MVPEIKRFSRIARLMAAAAGLTLTLGGCGALKLGDQDTGRLGAGERQQLNSSLKVAAASAKAGQLGTAERLYTQLARHFPNAPEPRFGLAYLALEAGNFTRAGKLFAEAGGRSATPVAKAEAWLGAGRASLGKGDVGAAKNHFLAAAELARGTAAEAWVANGLGVVATLESDHAGAKEHFDEAVQLSSSHPMMTANLVRALAQSGELGKARKLYAKYAASHWLKGDAASLSRLLEEKKSPMEGSGAQVQLYSAHSRDAALAAWERLSSEEQNLLSTLTPRVVRVALPKRRVVYRLRAGPLADKAAAGRLCGLLNGRGRNCFVASGKWTEDGAPARGDPSREAPPRKAQTSPAGGRVNSSKASPVARQATAPETASDIQVQVYSSSSRDAALAAWERLSSEEQNLLGALTPRVVRTELPKKGVVYRLRAGPLADQAAATRLCRLLQDRGRDCFVAPKKRRGGAGPVGRAVTRKRQTGPAGKRAGTNVASPKAPEATSPAMASDIQVQLYSSRSRDAALAAWKRLSAEERNLLGALTPRVVRTELPKRGVVYRLRAGPLADKAAARRLCGLLKGRGRDCFVPSNR